MCCNHEKEIKDLNYKLTIARNELKNIRKTLHNLQNDFQKETKQIKLAMNRPVEENLKPKIMFQPIGYIKTDFKEKRGIPRQTTAGDSITGCLILDSKFITNPQHALEGLEQFSHAWIVFHFHNTDSKHFQTKVTPPRLNGTKTGVFSTRSPHRPNPVGLSLVKLGTIDKNKINFTGVDMQNDTPVLDIKPFIPSYDYPEDEIKVPAWVVTSRELSVDFSDEASIKLQVFTDLSKKDIRDILKCDPRSIYLKTKHKDEPYKLTFKDFEINTVFDDKNCRVVVKDIVKIN